jgi:hypothetical protein
MRRTLIPALILVCGVAAKGNDGAASTAAGGIQLKREARISMEKERLVISEQKITVEYEFLNETDRDITTEVAFPIPPYTRSLDNDQPQAVDNFRIWIEGREIKYQTEARAMLGNVDYGDRLRQLGIDIVTLGHFEYPADQNATFSRDFDKLSKQQQDELRRLGLFDEAFPQWKVALTHHWQQTFPARKILHVRHEYKPVTGDMITGLGDLISPQPETRHLANFAQWCIDPPLRKTLTGVIRKKGFSSVRWVDYILTTANTWRTPIKEFELVVERRNPDFIPGNDYTARHYFVSFCWDGPVAQPDPDHFVARATNFVPAKELSIAFFPGD